MADVIEAVSWAFEGLEHMDAGYSAMLAANDGNIYTALCTHNGVDDAVLVRLEPAAGNVRVLANMGAVTGDKGTPPIPQGKVHTRMGQGAGGCVWFATHPTYPVGAIPAGAPSGHVVAYDPATDVCRSLARAPAREAIITAAFDAERNVMVGLSNPSGRLLVCDLARGEMRDLGPQTNGASPCRTIGIDGDGNAWFTREPGEIVRLAADSDKVEPIATKMPHPEFSSEAGMGVWRTVVWDRDARLFYGVHARTSHLFSFDPRDKSVRGIGSVSAEADRADALSTFASLALAQAPDKRLFTVAARGVFDFFNSRPLRGAAHLVGFEPKRDRIVDHGSIIADGDLRVWGSQNAAVSRDGRMLFLLGAVEARAGDRTVPATQLAVEQQGDIIKVPYQLRMVAIDLARL